MAMARTAPVPGSMLTEEMAAGRVETLLVLGGNRQYDQKGEKSY